MQAKEPKHPSSTSSFLYQGATFVCLLCFACVDVASVAASSVGVRAQLRSISQLKSVAHRALWLPQTFNRRRTWSSPTRQRLALVRRFEKETRLRALQKRKGTQGGRPPHPGTKASPVRARQKIPQPRRTKRALLRAKYKAFLGLSLQGKLQWLQKQPTPLPASLLALLDMEKKLFPSGAIVRLYWMGWRNRTCAKKSITATYFIRFCQKLHECGRYWGELLNDQSQRVRILAASAIAKYSARFSAKKLLVWWNARLKHKHLDVQYWAVETILRLKLPAAEKLPALRVALAHSNVQIKRRGAAYILAHKHPKLRGKAVETLLKAGTRKQQVVALGEAWHHGVGSKAALLSIILEHRSQQATVTTLQTPPPCRKPTPFERMWGGSRGLGHGRPTLPYTIFREQVRHALFHALLHRERVKFSARAKGPLLSHPQWVLKQMQRYTKSCQEKLHWDQKQPDEDHMQEQVAVLLRFARYAPRKIDHSGLVGANAYQKLLWVGAWLFSDPKQLTSTMLLSTLQTARPEYQLFLLNLMMFQRKNLGHLVPGVARFYKGLKATKTPKQTKVKRLAFSLLVRYPGAMRWWLAGLQDPTKAFRRWVCGAMPGLVRWRFGSQHNTMFLPQSGTLQWLSPRWRPLSVRPPWASKDKRAKETMAMLLCRRAADSSLKLAEKVQASMLRTIFKLGKQAKGALSCVRTFGMKSSSLPLTGLATELIAKHNKKFPKRSPTKK